MQYILHYICTPVYAYTIFTKYTLSTQYTYAYSICMYTVYTWYSVSYLAINYQISDHQSICISKTHTFND